VLDCLETQLIRGDLGLRLSGRHDVRLALGRRESAAELVRWLLRTGRLLIYGKAVRLYDDAEA
jgi:hypothetical protein